MRKRPLFMGACVFAIGLLYAEYRMWYGILLLLLIVFYAVELLIRKRQWRRLLVRILWIFGVFLLAVFHMKVEISIRQAELSQIAAEDELLLCGRIYKKELKYETYRYYLKDCIAKTSNQQVICNSVIAYLDADSYSIGETLLLKGKVHIFEKATNEGQFDSFSFYASQKIDFALKEARILSSDGRLDLVAEWLYRWRSRIVSIYNRYLGANQAGVLGTMLLGDKSSLDREVKELYQAAGISHILSISGMHVALVGMGIYRFLRKRGIRYGKAFLIAFPVLSMYAVMTGNSVSTLRALGMLFIAMAADVFGRSYDMLNALGGVVILLLWENPFWLWYSGFLFSVCAVIGIAVFVKYLQVKRKTDQKAARSSFGGKLINMLYSSLGIWLVTIPLVAWNYYEIPVYSFLLNAFILPFLKPLFLFGLSGGILGGNLAKGLLFPCNAILMLYEILAELCMRLPGATWIVGKPSVARIVFYYVVLVLVGQLCRKFKDRNLVRVVGFAILLLIFLVPGKKDFEVDVLDVGQGDGIYICTENGTSIFIDGGSSNVSKVGEYRILPFLKCKGIRKVDYWFVSHSDEDHIGGLREVLEDGYEVSYLVVAEATIDEEGVIENKIAKDRLEESENGEGGLEELLQLARENGTEIVYIKAGDRFEFGEELFTCLYPAAAEQAADTNDLSLVMLYEGNAMKGIFAGDISSSVEQKLMNEYDKQVLDVDFYKVSHHGSKHSSSEEFLRVLSPEISVISCSSTNSYGHPHQETLERLREAGCDIYVTMYGGQITVGTGKEQGGGEGDQTDEDGLWAKYPLLTDK
ncbi:MAG: DNA internalization-related competence protein ComEC/Rec2 [Agathobacter sp.]